MLVVDMLRQGVFLAMLAHVVRKLGTRRRVLHALLELVSAVLVCRSSGDGPHASPFPGIGCLALGASLIDACINRSSLRRFGGKCVKLHLVSANGQSSSAQAGSHPCGCLAWSSVVNSHVGAGFEWRHFRLMGGGRRSKEGFSHS